MNSLRNLLSVDMHRTKSHQSPPTVVVPNENSTADIEAVRGDSSSCWDDGTGPTNNNIRSRLKARSSSPTQSHSGSIDETDRLPLLRQDSSSDSEDSEPELSPVAPTTTSNILQWVKLLGLAAVLTTFIHSTGGIFLETAYFPAHGYMFTGGLRHLTVTPTTNYQPNNNNNNNNQQVHIPRIVHVTYKSREELPTEWQESLKQWETVHPDWEVRFWSDADIEAFVHEQFPQVEELHKSYKYMIQRVDSVRYMILYHFGGVYSDMDIYPATALDNLLAQWEDAGKSVLLAETSNQGVTNAFMASAPRTSFMQCVIENLPNYQHAFHHVIHWQHWEVLSSAGSTYLWGMVGHCSQHKEEVQIMAARSFRGCSACDSWETGKPAETCDTEWLHHSSTNSSWHQHGNIFHATCFYIAYSFACRPWRSCFIVVTLLLVLVPKLRKARRRVALMSKA